MAAKKDKNFHLVCGLETEYGELFVTQEGELVSPHELPQDGASWPFLRLSQLVKKPFSERHPTLQKLLVCEGSKHNFWIAKTGARFYSDAGSIPEYATPTCDNIEQLVWADKGGEKIVHWLMNLVCEEGLFRKKSVFQKIIIIKNNSDILGGGDVRRKHFWGSHEDYEVSDGFVGSDGPTLTLTGASRKDWFANLLALRQLLCGGGGLFPDGYAWKYIISPRTLVVNRIFGVNNDAFRPFNKPMMFYKMDDYCVSDGRIRLQVIVGDSNMMPCALAFRLVVAAVFLKLIHLDAWRLKGAPRFRNPVRALKIFSLDPALRVKIATLRPRESLTLSEAFLKWLDVLLNFAESGNGAVNLYERRILEEAYKLAAESRKGPEALFDKTDWGLRLKLLRQYCRRKNVDFSHKKTRVFDAYYSEISPEGVYNRWQRGVEKQDPFSEQELGRCIWSHCAAPRSELEKRYLAVLAQSNQPALSHHWGRFDINPADPIYIHSPFQGAHPRVDKYIKDMERRIREGKIKFSMGPRLSQPAFEL